MTKKTSGGPENFIRSAREALDRLEDGGDFSLRTSFDYVSGIGRVETLSADGKDVDEADLPALPFDTSDEPDTAPGSKGKGR